MITILGVDIAFRNMGLATMTYDGKSLNVVKLKLVTTEKSPNKQALVSNDDLRCARELRGALLAEMWGCDMVMAEIPTGSQSARASWTLGISTGVLSTIDLPMIEVSATEGKLASVGKKTASKQSMIDWAYNKYPKAEWLTTRRKGSWELVLANEHLADAIAAVHAGIKKQEFKLIQMGQ